MGEWRGWPHEPDWREQTAADLSPAALGREPLTLACAVDHGGEPCPGYPSDWDGGDVPDDPVFDEPGDSGPAHIHNGSCSGGRCWDGGPGREPFVNNLPADWEGTPIQVLIGPRAETERLADTGDIRGARLLAEVAADLRAQDDDTAEYLSRMRSDMAQYRLDLAAALS